MPSAEGSNCCNHSNRAPRPSATPWIFCRLLNLQTAQLKLNLDSESPPQGGVLFSSSSKTKNSFRRWAAWAAGRQTCFQADQPAGSLARCPNRRAACRFPKLALTLSKKFSLFSCQLWGIRILQLCNFLNCAAYSISRLSGIFFCSVSHKPRDRSKRDGMNCSLSLCPVQIGRVKIEWI